MFANGQKPTGNKDPLVLRRFAIGILRILMDTHIDIPSERGIIYLRLFIKRLHNSHQH